MTVPATVSITAASIGLLAALLAFGMSSAPGWRELRWFALCATFAALFSLSNVVVTLDAAPSVMRASARFGLFCAGIHAAAWFKFTATHESRRVSRWERVWVAVGLFFSLLALVPGLLIQDQVAPRVVPILHVTYAEFPPTSLGSVAMGFYILTLFALFVRALRRALAGDSSMRTHAIALGALAFGGAHDNLATLDVLPAPYLLDVSLLVFVLAVGGSITTRFVASARALEASSRELEAAHQALVQKERLAALGELSAVVAHEVRNPLAVVFNATAGLRRAQPGSPDHAALVSIVQEEAERLRDIVSDLLEFARPRPPVLAIASLDEIVRSAVEAACSVVGAERTDVIVEVEGEVERMTCDDRLVRQAIVNLVTNALQANGRRGPVLVGVSEDRSRRAMLVKVTDDGNGVSEELREKIFTPFFSTRPKGTGLGLTVVRRCADAHGGDIVVHPSDAGGATFELQLPRRVG